VTDSTPLLLTAGEPAGIGPELCLSIASRTDLPSFVVVSDADLLRSRARSLGANVKISEVDRDSLGNRIAKHNELLVTSFPFPVAARAGAPDPANAQVLLDGLDYAVDACKTGLCRGLVTGPVHKGVINDAGLPFTGHTEFLARAAGATLPVMLLVAGDLRVALATTHLPLRDVPGAITGDRLRVVIDVMLTDLRKRFGLSSPGIVVCGLNPHAGEGGHLGEEDATIIAPIVEEFAAAGEDVRGPVPADTAFTAASGPKDAVLAMYHDQGLPVLKYAGFGGAVNVTLGLPIVRTSVDHGTALDIAGTGKADPGSLIAALRLADELAR
jgi:4-hydroxythreonine-4-phosphate dehydrogenase